MPIPRDDKYYKNEEAIRRISRDNDFVVQGYLGGGGFADVFSVIDNREGSLTRGQTMALKYQEYTGLRNRHLEITPQDHIYEGMLQNWVRHPNILPIDEIGVKEEYAYFIMPQCEGGDVGDLFPKYGGNVSYEVALTVLGQMAEAMEALTAAGVDNHEIKPFNCLLLHPVTDDPKSVHVVVSDFGQARGLSPDRLPSVGEFGPEVDHNNVFVSSLLLVGQENGHWHQPKIREVHPEKADKRFELSAASCLSAREGNGYMITDEVLAEHFGHRPKASLWERLTGRSDAIVEPDVIPSLRLKQKPPAQEVWDHHSPQAVGEAIGVSDELILGESNNIGMLVGAAKGMLLARAKWEENHELVDAILQRREVKTPREYVERLAHVLDMEPYLISPRSAVEQVVESGQVVGSGLGCGAAGR